MIDAKQAVKIATEYLRDMYEADGFTDMMLEEVELSDEDKYWHVTICFTRRQVSTAEGPMASLVGSRDEYMREVKVFTIDSQSGLVRSMKKKKRE